MTEEEQIALAMQMSLNDVSGAAAGERLLESPENPGGRKKLGLLSNFNGLNGGNPHNSAITDRYEDYCVNYVCCCLLHLHSTFPCLRNVW